MSKNIPQFDFLRPKISNKNYKKIEQGLDDYYQELSEDMQEIAKNDKEAEKMVRDIYNLSIATTLGINENDFVEDELVNYQNRINMEGSFDIQNYIIAHELSEKMKNRTQNFKSLIFIQLLKKDSSIIRVLGNVFGYLNEKIQKDVVKYYNSEENKNFIERYGDAEWIDVVFNVFKKITDQNLLEIVAKNARISSIMEHRDRLDISDWGLFNKIKDREDFDYSSFIAHDINKMPNIDNERVINDFLSQKGYKYLALSDYAVLFNNIKNLKISEEKLIDLCRKHFHFDVIIMCLDRISPKLHQKIVNDIIDFYKKAEKRYSFRVDKINPFSAKIKLSIRREFDYEKF